MQKKKTTQRIVSWLLMLSFVFSIGNVSVLAAEAEQTISAAVEEALAAYADAKNASTKELIDVSGGISLMSIEADATYTVAAGLTKSFENLSTVDLTITVSDDEKDYVVFYQDGSIKGYDRNSSIEDITVPTGGKLIITARTKDISCEIADDYFIVNDLSQPVFIKTIINDRETYSFTNTSLIPMKLLATRQHRDLVVHNRDGSLHAQARDTYWSSGSYEIPAGATMKITAREDGLEICALNNYFTVALQDTQVYRKRLFASGETYSFTNVSDSPYYLVSNATNRDYVVYAGSGNITTHERDTHWGTATQYEVPSGSTIKITARHSGLEVCGLTEYFTVQKEATQVYKKILMASGETYSFTNVSDSPYTLRSDSSGRDFVLYAGSGSITAHARNTYWGSDMRYEVPSGSTMKITARKTGLEICALSEIFSVKKEAVPVYTKIMIPAGETYSFKNTSNLTFSLRSNTDAYRDSVLYDSTGAVTTHIRNTQWLSSEQSEVPAGSTMKVTSRNTSLEICALSEVFSVEKESVPVYTKIMIPAGETYSFKNISNLTFSLLSNSEYRDSVLYDSTGAVTTQLQDTIWLSSKQSEVPAGSTMKVTSRSSALEICALSEMFRVAAENSAVFKTVTIPKGEQHTFTNISEKDYKLLVSGDNIDYILRDNAGTEVSSVTNKSLSSIDVPSGYSVALTATKQPIECCALDEAFVASAGNITGTYTVLQKGKSYEFTNLNTADYTLYWDDSDIIYDYIIYGAENTIVNYAFSVNRTKVVIPSGGRAIFTPKSTFSVSKNADIITKEVATPAYQAVNSIQGETYCFENTSLTAASLTLSAGRYNYIFYNQQGQITTYTIDHNITSLSVPAETSVSVTARELSGVIAAPGELFTITKNAAKHFDVKVLEAGETISLRNISSKDYTIFLREALYDYVSYNADNSIKAYAYDATADSMTITSNTSVVLTAQKPMVVEYINGIFELEAQDEPVFNRTSVYKGETLRVKNTSIKDYKAFVITDYHDRVTYDATEAITSMAMQGNAKEYTLASGTEIVLTAINANLTVVTLNDLFMVKTRSYPALFRHTLYENEKFSFTNGYKREAVLQNTNSKLSYSIYTETGSLIEDDDEVQKNSMSVPAGGKAVIEAKSASITFAGAYEAFSGEDLTVKATGITLSNSNINLAVGNQMLIRASVVPDETTNKTVKWESSDTDIAAVAQTGKVIAKAVGTATITATTVDGGFSATCTVNVLEAGQDTVAVTGITVDKTSLSLFVDETDIVTAEITPSNASDKTILWTSTNTSVATVAGGIVTAKAPGTATIIAISLDGSYTAMCNVKVLALSDSDGIIASGKDANGIGWFLYDDGKFVISGTGSMTDYDSTYSIPWYDYRTDIKEIVVENGIDHIAARAFYNCINATKAEISATVQSIGIYAFKNCDAITIYGAKDSYVHTYANANRIPFVPVAILLDATVTQEETSTRRYFHVSVAGYTEEADVYIGVYDSNDTLLAAYKESFVPDDVTSLSTLKQGNEKYVKVFVWSNWVRPVTSVKRIDLN